MTARVLVNRVWQNCFGEGLVATPNDFGRAGARPSDPELLDWLAGEFVRGGWSLKKLQRLIFTSATYRQSRTPRRLTAEQLRDAMLAVAGHLTSSEGGPPVWPELPDEVLKANPAFLDDNAEKAKGWYPSPPEKRDVRSIFLVQKRTVRIPLMETFDLPENAVSCARRNVSPRTPALTLLNSPFTAKCRALHARARGEETARRCGAPVGRVFALNTSFPGCPRTRHCLRFRAERNVTELCRAVLSKWVYISIERARPRQSSCCRNSSRLECEFPYACRCKYHKPNKNDGSLNRLRETRIEKHEARRSRDIYLERDSLNYDSSSFGVHRTQSQKSEFIPIAIYKILSGQCRQ